MQEYLSKLQELHKGGLLTEHQRKKLKEGILLQAPRFSSLWMILMLMIYHHKKRL